MMVIQSYLISLKKKVKPLNQSCWNTYILSVKCINQFHFHLGSAREFVNEYSWSIEGEYEVNITLENLHSEELFGHVKYIHNFTKIVHIQYPVMDFKDDDIVLDWFVTDDVDFILKLGLQNNCTSKANFFGDTSYRIFKAAPAQVQPSAKRFLLLLHVPF